MTDIIERKPWFTLPLAEGDDLTVNFTYMEELLDDDGAPILDGQGQVQYVETDYPPDVSVVLIIDTHPVATVIEAVVDGKDALVHASYTVTDPIPAGLDWRVKVLYPDGDPPMGKVTAHGKTDRDNHDV